MPDAEQSSARILAPAALAVCAIAFFGVILVSGGDGGGGEDREERTSTAERRAKRSAPAGQPPAATYTVKSGDTLAGIADENRVSVERIQELNPELDPQALVSGQKIKLRE
jgi:LysM domain